MVGSLEHIPESSVDLESQPSLKMGLAPIHRVSKSKNKLTDSATTVGEYIALGGSVKNLRDEIDSGYINLPEFLSRQALGTSLSSGDYDSNLWFTKDELEFESCLLQTIESTVQQAEASNLLWDIHVPCL